MSRVGAGGLHGTLGGVELLHRVSGGETSRDQLAADGNIPCRVRTRQIGEGRWIESKIVEGVGFRGVEDTKGAAHDGVVR